MEEKVSSPSLICYDSAIKILYSFIKSENAVEAKTCGSFDLQVFYFRGKSRIRT
ncbi:hypothetical protein K6T82_03135 [Flavobacterium sp. 17A]|uniref:Uncharacterized protein n=1 Tax=Flavobacterium potami TaxID=2872310 RepID=A0A9X1KMX3_9FLAO|nr:hypothetical protein [Flavobacterium potami]MBZ4033743.1 hypothetical protein [Flavobacterium potami]